MDIELRTRLHAHSHARGFSPMCGLFHQENVLFEDILFYYSYIYTVNPSIMYC